MTTTGTTKRDSAWKNTKESGFAFGATRSLAIPFPGYKSEKCATILFKLLAFLMPNKFLVEVCVFFHKTGIFFLNFFDVFRKQIELRFKK